MGLSMDLITDLVKATKTDEPIDKESSAYGTVVKYNNAMYVRLDGSDLLTPVSTTVALADGDRVIVTIKQHSATVTGNTTTPAASSKDVAEIGSKISEFEIVIADKVSTKEFEAQIGRINQLTTDNATINEKLTAAEADIDKLHTKDAEITGTLDAAAADIEQLKAGKIDADAADLKYATIKELGVTNETVRNIAGDFADFEQATVDRLDADEATIKELNTKKLDADEAEIKFANVDFSNITKAAIEYFYSTSGIIKDLVLENGTVTGELVGITIKGDQIEGNTIVADKLVVKGSDGLYYKLNTDGMTVEKEQTDYNSLNGSIIRAKSITATKIDVDDLVAFGATIGGFHIGQNSLYSGVKESVDNTTRGIYMDTDGQLAIGDSKNFIKYYKDADGKYRLAISAESMIFSSSGSTVEETINEIQNNLDNIREEVVSIVTITSSKGTVFKNTNVSTVLSVTIFRGTAQITDIETLHKVYGDGAYLQWKSKEHDEDDFLLIPSIDERISEGGFKFAISPNNVDTKGNYVCDLMVPD